MKAYHIYLFRHGQTQANKEGRYVGRRTDVPLNREGEEQLLRMRKEYSYPQAELFFTSPMRRCIRTLELLYPGAEPQVVQDLAECDFGDFEGKTLDELKDDNAFRDWNMKLGKSAPPNGEGGAEFQTRCCAAFERIVDQLLRSGTTRAVLVAHGGTLMYILGTYGFPRRPFFEWMTGNGMGFEVVITPQLWMSTKAMDIVARIPKTDEEGLAGLQGLKEWFTQMREEEKDS